MNHEHFMALAIREAEKGLYSARPNPRVGCVLEKDGEILGRGYHVQTGTAHAEVNALADAGDKDLSNATAYVTLEPCSFVGRTPSCAETLIERGIRRVVFAGEDPHPGNRGKGLDKLRAAGIEVIGPVLEAAAEAINPGHFKKYRHGLPYVRLKLAQSLDGRTALANGKSQWITGEAARLDVQRWRARSCAVVTGVDTVIADNPRLNVRAEAIDHAHGDIAASIRRPIVVLDSRGRMPADAVLRKSPNLLLVQTKAAGALQGDNSVALPADDKGQIDLTQLLQFLVDEEDCSEVLFECGATLANSLLQSGLMDELILYVAPKLMGSDGRSAFALNGLVDMADTPEFEIKDSRRVGADLRLVLQTEHKKQDLK